MQNKWKSAFETAILKAGDYFHRQQWKEFFIFTAFVLLAFVFWLIQSLQDDSERRIEIPVRYSDVPNEWTLSENNPKTVSVLLKDKGISLLYNYFWKKRRYSIDISVSDLQPVSDSTLQITNRMLETELSKQLLTSTSIVSVEPHEIRLYYDMLSARLTPVRANVSVTTKPGFQVFDSITVSPSEARLYGSAKIIDTLNNVKTKPVTLEGLSKTSELKVQLDLPTGVKADIETVSLTIPVEEFTEKKLRLMIQCPDIPEDNVLRMFPSSVEVACNLPLSHFRELTEDILEIRIPFAEFTENQATGKIPVRLTQKPSWVTNPIITPGEVEFIVERHD